MVEMRTHYFQFQNFFKKDFFKNSFYSIQFICVLVPYHQIKCKLNSKSQKSQNIQIWRAAKIELKHLICYKQGHSLENMYTSVWSAHQV